ncbi:protoheme IX farnesyltransferase [Thermanaerothrix daxensis]|uniref:protoheme IX farnesyltransferase n=1 Tax=Thermanaerothrix daxensis TaxID=869279 RepID=UPI0006C8E9AB|nr:UbiA family prenyltransferase [Thermanaerothrix daxensis]
MQTWLTVIKQRIRLYGSLIKPLQTGLLLATGLAGYMSARCPVYHLDSVFVLGVSLGLAISGSTVLNMWWDRDIDAKMQRTQSRPLAAGVLTPHETFILGVILSVLGVGWAFGISTGYGWIVFAGWFFDVIVYTLWLKRRTCWSILWGGISGGMPVLAGRTLGTGTIDGIGLLLALAVLFWIPTHILTFSLKHFNEYQAAHIPTFPARYGFRTTRLIITISSLLATAAITLAGIWLGMQWGYLRLLLVLSAGLLCLALIVMLRPTERTHFSLYKYASLYMLSAMLLLAL